MKNNTKLNTVQNGKGFKWRKGVNYRNFWDNYDKIKGMKNDKNTQSNSDQQTNER